jgi:FAD:protein FMN transferase
MAPLTAGHEISAEFECFGSTCAVHVAGHGSLGSAGDAVAEAERRLRRWHQQFSRFDRDSELARLNSDPRRTVPVSPMMARFLESVSAVGSLTGGLVDGTLVSEIEQAGYAAHFEANPIPLAVALALAPPRRAARPSRSARWRELSDDHAAGTVTRPPGLRLDSGGIAKGLFTDELSLVLAEYRSFAVDCGGDIRLGGAERLIREIKVASPFEERILTTLEASDGAIATSGIGKRSWRGPDGSTAHHLIDPGTGKPAFTGIVQVTALAPTGVMAEALSKAALLAGPQAADRWLTRGGVIVYDDGSYRTIPPASGS